MDSSNESQAPTAIGSFLRAIGGWSKPSGRGILMFRMLTVGSTVGAVTGVVGALLATIVAGCGPIGFAIGSSLGYTISIFMYFRGNVRAALSVLATHPKLMHHHLVRNFYMGNYHELDLSTREKTQAYIEEVSGSWPKKCELVTAYQTAGPAMEDIQERQESLIIEQLAMKRPVWLDDEE